MLHLNSSGCSTGYAVTLTAKAEPISQPQPVARGELVLVVGPSGAGKDTLMLAARDALAGDPRIIFARRIITRSSHDTAESHDTLPRERFDEARRQGAFLLSWQAHGLGYAIPRSVESHLAADGVVVANVSRTSIPEAERLVARVTVLHVTAPQEVLASRIAARGREPLSEVAARLSRQPPLAISTAELVEIVNDADVASAAARLTAVLTRLADRAAAHARRS
jgi:phosphonate metabolism protein PhnN/1,5-bisphosphokinase (PRPP-forming)